MSLLRNLLAAARRPGGASLLIVVGALVIFYLPGSGRHLQYDTAAITVGQLWRVVTCHLTHWSLDHLIWDAGTLLVLGACCETSYRRAFVGCLAASAFIIPLAVWACMPDINTYRGLSGIDSAVFVLLAVRICADSLAKRHYRTVAISGLVLVAFAAKVAYECLADATLFVDSAEAAFTPLPLAHVVGGIVGATIALLPVPARTIRKFVGSVRPPEPCARRILGDTSQDRAAAPTPTFIAARVSTRPTATRRCRPCLACMGRRHSRQSDP